jgi:hypothetical protein
MLNIFDSMRKLFPNKSEKCKNDIDNHVFKLHYKVRSNNEIKLWQDLFCVQVTVLILVGMTCLLGMTQFFGSPIEYLRGAVKIQNW